MKTDDKKMFVNNAYVFSSLLVVVIIYFNLAMALQQLKNSTSITDL